VPVNSDVGEGVRIWAAISYIIQYSKEEWVDEGFETIEKTGLYV
jgi:hypothetical protein